MICPCRTHLAHRHSTVRLPSFGPCSVKAVRSPPSSTTRARRHHSFMSCLLLRVRRSFLFSFSSLLFDSQAPPLRPLLGPSYMVNFYAFYLLCLILRFGQPPAQVAKRSPSTPPLVSFCLSCRIWPIIPYDHSGRATSS